MKIEEVRTSFTVYLIASELNRLDGIAESLGLAGYMAATFSELTAAFSEFPSNPPHFLLFDATETRFNLGKAIQQVSAQLPESHIFLLTPIERRAEYVDLLEKGVYELIYTPLASPLELLRALDRAAERDYFMYLNERLAESAESDTKAEGTVVSVTSVTSSERPESSDFARQLFEAKTSDECVQVFMRSIAGVLDDCGGIFFKYVANRRVLVATQVIHLDNIELNGLGVNLNEPGSQFKSLHLKDPMAIPELQGMVQEVFNTEKFFAYPLEALGEIQGVVVFLCEEPGGDLGPMLHNWLVLTDKALSLIESERRLHVTAVKDPVTELLNRANFLGKIQQEISRARRTSLPVSLLSIAVDQFGQIVSQLGPEEGNVVLRVIARILEKHSRVNDILGRIGADEFGILLPHTGKQGGMVKAERLRRMIHSADFGKVLSAFPSLTISIGVSEYPRLVRDAEELLQSADEALFAIRKSGNKTCVAQAPGDLTPDFVVPEKDGP